MARLMKVGIGFESRVETMKVQRVKLDAHAASLWRKRRLEFVYMRQRQRPLPKFGAPYQSLIWLMWQSRKINRFCQGSCDPNADGGDRSCG